MTIEPPVPAQAAAPVPVHIAPTSTAPTNVVAIIALVAAFLLPIGGIVLSFVAKRQIARTGEGGAGLAAAALILGIVFTILGIIVLVVVILVLVATGQFLGNVSEVLCGTAYCSG